MDIARKPLIILGDMQSSVARTFRLALTVAAITAAVACFPLAAQAHDPDGEEAALGSLLDAELAFARLALEQGIHAAFLTHFATDGIIFEPAPVRLHQAWSARPAPADPKALRLEWHPAQAGVARDHNMGYTTGAFALTDVARPERVKRGVFFSVWQRDPGGKKWEVVLDAGIVTPHAADFVLLGAAPRPRFTERADAKVERRTLLEREARSFDTASKSSGPASYASLLAPDVRLHRDGMAPLGGRAAVARYFAQRATRIAWSPMDARVSSSGDLAVTYGKYRETGPTSHVQEGYYTHLWLRDAGGRWRLAYDIATAAS
jgi:ketosteroid isomerase-like protein